MTRFFAAIALMGVVLTASMTAPLAQSVERVRLGIHSDMTRVVLDIKGVSSDISYDVGIANDGSALLVNFTKNISWNALRLSNKSNGIIDGYKFNTHSNGGDFLVTTRVPIKIKRSFVLPSSARHRARIVFDLVEDKTPINLSKLASQRTIASPPQALSRFAIAPDLSVQLSQATPMPQESWLKNWLSGSAPRKIRAQTQLTFITPQVEQIQQPQRSAPFLNLRPYSSPPSVADPSTPIGFENQSMPIVSNSLRQKYKLPNSAQLDPMQKQAHSVKIIQGPYIGVNFGASIIDYKISNNSDSADIKSKEPYFKVFAGHRFNRFFSAEVFYSNLGESTKTSLGNKSAEAKFSAGGAALQVGSPVLEQLVPFVKVGFITFNEDSKIAGADVGGWLPRSYLATGIDFWFTPKVGFRGEVENFALDITSVSGALMYKF